MTTASEDADEAMALTRATSKLFAGKAADVQGAALADLLALWLAGHVVPGDPEGTQLVRDAILEMHLAAMWKLVPINFKYQIEPRMPKGRADA
jgi:hypothetical protein